MSKFPHNDIRFQNPRSYNSQGKGPYTKYPPSGFQLRPYSYYGSVKSQAMTVNNDEHWCETCDRGFPTADILHKHVQQHEKCNIDGCQFVAHPKIITRHIQMQHSSGLYKKIAKLQNPEEIQKWREERKKKYPTRSNIEKKAAECKEKIERGEKMALKQDRLRTNNNKSTDPPPGRRKPFGFNKNNQAEKNNKRNNSQRQNFSHANGQQPVKKNPKTLPKIPGVLEKSKLPAFTGLLNIPMEDDSVQDTCNLLNCSNSLIEEDEYSEETVEKPKEIIIQEPVLCGALTSLMCEYGSSGEEPDRNANNKTSSIEIAKKSLHIDRIHKNLDTVNDKNTKMHMDIVKNNEKNVEAATTNNIVSNLTSFKSNEDKSDDDSGPEEIATVKMDIVEPTSLEIAKSIPLHVNNTKRNISSRNDQKHNNRFKHKVPSTLLQKLLYKEIRQERNIMLQCIRYIKKMNYFDKSAE